MTNVRIARRIRTIEGALIRVEVLGEFFHPPMPLDYIRRQLALAQAEEPHAGWTLETRGTERGWRPWEE
jgi:hypothetical protein